MSISSKPATTPTSIEGGTDTGAQKDNTARQQFVAAVANMSWQLAGVVLIPVVGGFEIGKALGAPTAGVLVGLGIALVGSIAVMWRIVRAANRLPVPKLTEAEKRAIRKSYEAEDDE